jgi:hypothetical protein
MEARKSVIKMAPHARGKRVWLQGAWLVKYGFGRGTPIKVTIDASGMVIEADAAGDRRVAGKDVQPIIDVIGSAVSAAFPEAFALVVVTPGMITVAPSTEKGAI